MAIKQELELAQKQKLSPLQIQTIKLIELPIQELEQKIRSEFADNPVLDDTPDPERERDDDAPKDVSIDEIKEDDYIPDYKTKVKNWGKDPRPEYNTFSVREGFTQSLKDQLGYCNLDDHQRQIAEFIVGSLDEDGYLRRDTDTLVDDLAFRAGITTDEEEVEKMIKVVQSLEPTGVGARDGGQVSDSYADAAQQIVPDFVLHERDGELYFDMPRFKIPEIRVKRVYADMLDNAKGSGSRAQKEAVTFVRSKLDSAKWFVEALKQRQNTLQRTMQAILDFQHDYFLSGDDADLRPMVLKDIAEVTGFDISTISRVVSSKYIETSFGIIRLKHFFSEGMENSEGEEVSTRELKKALRECVDAEDKKKPLTDEQLVVEMEKLGYKVARRTIAKYRSQLGIPLARWRKEL